jgi:hypothetical protein
MLNFVEPVSACRCTCIAWCNCLGLFETLKLAVCLGGVSASDSPGCKPSCALVCGITDKSQAGVDDYITSHAVLTFSWISTV